MEAPAVSISLPVPTGPVAWACVRILCLSLSRRCTECAKIHSLKPDFDVLTNSIDSMVSRLERSASLEASSGGGSGAVLLQTAQQAAAEKARVSLKQLSVAISRALQKVAAFAAHERRAAHEARVLEMLLESLDETGCILIADWKQKFLPSVFREAMSDYFGQAGMQAEPGF